MLTLSTARACHPPGSAGRSRRSSALRAVRIRGGCFQGLARFARGAPGTRRWPCRAGVRRHRRRPCRRRLQLGNRCWPCRAGLAFARQATTCSTRLVRNSPCAGVRRLSAGLERRRLHAVMACWSGRRLRCRAAFCAFRRKTGRACRRFRPGLPGRCCETAPPATGSPVARASGPIANAGAARC